MTFTEKLNIVLANKNMTKKELAEKLEVTQQALLMKIKSEKFTEKDMVQIAEILNYDLDIILSDRDSDMKI